MADEPTPVQRLDQAIDSGAFERQLAARMVAAGRVEVRCWNMVPARTDEDRDGRKATRFGFNVGQAQVWTGTVDHADLWRVLAEAGLLTRDAEMEARHRPRRQP